MFGDSGGLIKSMLKTFTPGRETKALTGRLSFILLRYTITQSVFDEAGLAEQ
jgi:hypothetical protein